MKFPFRRQGQRLQQTRNHSDSRARAVRLECRQMALFRAGGVARLQHSLSKGIASYYCPE